MSCPMVPVIRLLAWPEQSDSVDMLANHKTIYPLTEWRLKNRVPEGGSP